jgi:hypothetical protein
MVSCSLTTWVRLLEEADVARLPNADVLVEFEALVSGRD